MRGRAKKRPSRSSAPVRQRELRGRLAKIQRLLRTMNSHPGWAVVADDGEEVRIFPRKAGARPLLVLDGESEASAALGPDGTVLACTDRFAQALGIAPETLPGSSLRAWMKRPSELGASACEAREITLRARAGAELPALLAPCSGEPGGCARVCVLLEERASEGHALHRRAIERAIRARDEFLSVASHELKTPLTTLGLQVEGMLRAARKDPSRVTPEWLETKLEIVQRQNHRLTQLVNELLDVSRIQAGRLDLVLKEVDLGALVREVVDRFAQEAAAAGCPVVLDLDGSLVGRWDRSRLDQVLTNLVSNAIKYGQGAPIELIARGGAQVVLEVRDHGIGIAPDDQRRIFQQFERVVSGDKYRGMGLGLWITRRLVERMGGSIQVESALGEGACFTVQLPLASPSDRGAPKPLSAAG